MNFRFVFIALFTLSYCAYAQDSDTTQEEVIEKKQLQISRTTTAPKIDGILNDLVWENADIATDFIQFRPDMGKAATEDIKTVVKMAYDDSGIYVAAYMYDDPKLISKQFTSRDNFGQSDFFLVVLNPNNDAQNDTEFFVFTSGTQADAVANPSNGEDFGWNAVWDSAVQINDDGWAVEMKIPYRALRFSTDVETWGLQFHRRFRRNNEQYTWNPLDVTKGNIGLYHGELNGIKDIEPPVRLNLYPFASTVFDNMDKPNFNIGMDVKYGITENITLDATLIPDFSQAGFDNLSLNLGPFEQTFSDQRQFFTEGVDLFNKGNLFFSRRVGGHPSRRPNLADNEQVTNDIKEVKVLNAVKVSGRTKKGLGVGFFNAITEKTDARILNTETGETRTETVEPFTNYNIFVLDQQFNGNSSIAVVNTNVTREGHFRDANVTALVANVFNKRNTYNIRGDVKMSNRNLADGIETGLSSFIYVRKAHGKFRYSFDHSFSNENFNINDLGLNNTNNFNNFGVDAWYQIFEPTKKLNNFYVGAWYNYRRLFSPSKFSGQNAGVSLNGKTKKELMDFGGNINYQMGKQYDFFEPRDFENKRFFIYENRVNGNVWISSNYNKPLAIDANIGGATLFEKERDYKVLWFSVGPRIQFSDKFLVSYSFSYENEWKDRGYANNSNSIDNQIIFGQRDQLTIVNRISGGYNFDPFNSINLTFRNYWTTVNYEDNPYFLQDNGRLIQSPNTFSQLGLESSDINFSTWNVDLSYSWQFAPGSFLTALYRNQLFNSNALADENFFDSLNNLLDQDMQHILSIRLQYFIDYGGIKSIFKKKNQSVDKVSKLSQLMNPNMTIL
ncbi:DUF5916 domain-containing protein [Psychroserpens algicola]|uniref:DUF5916 domain-containing protein n=1 Tax=Psychroserpens algicola TaxID=1719034 RepID=UPI001954BFFA|nr:DUF5916 domain-containing protein [Psychroserpens algicola]